MKLTDWLINNIRIFHKVSNIPTEDKSKGIYFVWNDEFTGLYIVTDKNNVKSVKKIFNTSDYYITSVIDEKIKTLSDNVNSRLDEQDQTISNISSLGIRKVYTTYAVMQADVSTPIGDDGDSIKNGQLVSVKNDTDSSLNGIYAYVINSSTNVKSWTKTSNAPSIPNDVMLQGGYTGTGADLNLSMQQMDEKKADAYKIGEDISSGNQVQELGYVSPVNGSFSTSTNQYNNTRFLPVLPGQLYEVEFENNNSFAGGVAGYDINRTFNYTDNGGTRIGTLLNTAATPTKKKTIVIPEGVYFIKGSARSSIGYMKISYVGQLLRTSEIDTSVDGSKKIADAKAVKDIYESTVKSSNITGNTVTEKKILSAESGNIDTSTLDYTRTTEYVRVNPGDVIYYTGAVPPHGAIAGYDINKIFVSEQISGRAKGSIILRSDIPLTPYPTTGTIYNSNYLLIRHKAIIPDGIFYILGITNQSVSGGETLIIERQGKPLRAYTGEASTDEIQAGVRSDRYISPKGLASISIGGVIPSFKGAKTSFGVKGDAKMYKTASITTGSNTVTCPNAAFTSADIGKKVAIPYAGIIGAANVANSHISTIVSVVNATTINIEDNVTQTIVAKRTLTDGAMVLGSDTLTSATANFTYTDIGKEIVVKGAGALRANASANSADLECRIVGWISATEVKLSLSAHRTVSSVNIIIDGATIIYGSDDTAALQNAFDITALNGQELILESGNYLTTDSLYVSSFLKVRGIGSSSKLLPVGNTAGVCGIRTRQGEGNTHNPYYDIHLRDFEIDCIGVTVNTYTSTCKCIYNLFQVRPVYSGLILRNSCGTAMGCDYLVDYVISNNNVYRGGRQVREMGGSAGGSGIGIGTGYWTVENGLISGNNVHECGVRGIFVESQSGNIQSKGVRIIGNYVANCHIGIGDNATYGTIISENQVDLCNTGIVVANGFNSILLSSEGVVKNNKLFGCGISINIKNGSYSVVSNEITAYSGLVSLLGNDSRGVMPGGISVSCSSEGILESLCIEDNKIHNINLNGITHSGKFKRVKIRNNDIIDIGYGTNAMAIDIQGAGLTMNNVYVDNNTIIEDRDVADKRIAKGINIRSTTIGRLIDRTNDIIGMKTADRDYSAATIGEIIN